MEFGFSCAGFLKEGDVFRRVEVPYGRVGVGSRDFVVVQPWKERGYMLAETEDGLKDGINKEAIEMRNYWEVVCFPHPRGVPNPLTLGDLKVGDRFRMEHEGLSTHPHVFRKVNVEWGVCPAPAVCEHCWKVFRFPPRCHVIRLEDE